MDSNWLWKTVGHFIFEIDVISLRSVVTVVHLLRCFVHEFSNLHLLSSHPVPSALGHEA